MIIYGATPAGIAAALAAADLGVGKIALIEKSAYVGGMMSPGGIGMRDFGNVKQFGTNSSSSII